MLSPLIGIFCLLAFDETRAAWRGSARDKEVRRERKKGG
jgi:hypothetical protein